MSVKDPSRRPSRIVHWLKRIVLVTVSLIVGLLLAELAVRIIAPQQMSGSWRVPAARGYALNKAGGTARHSFGDRVVTYRFNEFHQRGGAVDPSRPSVLVLGDSYTFGWLIAEEDTFVAGLQVLADRDLPESRVQILNGGAGGWGTAQYLAYLEDFGKDLSLRAVAVFLNHDDMRRSHRGGLYRISDEESLELEVLTSTPRQSSLKRLANSIPFYDWLLENSHLVQLVRNAIVRAKADDADTPEQTAAPHSGDSASSPSPLGRALFRRMALWCSAHDCELFVITTGMGTSAKSRWALSQDVNRAFLRDAPGMFEEEGIPFYDISRDLDAGCGTDRERCTIEGDGHPNELGHAEIAKAAWRWLGPRVEGALETR